MKYLIIISFLLVNNLIFSQIPEKDNILDGYYVGHKAFEAIQTLNHELIKEYYKDTTNLSYIIQEVETKRIHEDSIQIVKDVMFNQESGHYEFIVYGGKYIPTEDNWGLYEYYFVIEYEIDLKQKGSKYQILKTEIIRDKDLEGLKIWWRKYMRSYKEPKYARSEIADKYRLVPPPPPPPASKEWF